MKPTPLTLVLLVSLGLLIGFAGWVAYDTVSGIDVEIGTHGLIAMALGVIGSLVIGGGLMFLVFHSHRHRYDEMAHDPHADDP